MNLKLYDLLSILIPGFLLLIAGFLFLGIPYNDSLVIAYGAASFLIGYLVDAISSWLEGFYDWTWGGKPSVNLLDGKPIWKVRFPEYERARQLLQEEAGNQNLGNADLFQIARRYSAKKSSRVEEFNSSYAFSRSLLTCGLIAGTVLWINHYSDWHYPAIILPILFVLWLRAKQRNYYYAREVLNAYLRIKSKKN